MKHTVNPQLFVNITLVMVATILSACSSNSKYDNYSSYETKACPCVEQVYVDKVEVKEVNASVRPKAAISQSTPGGERAVPAKPRKAAPCVKQDWVEKGWVKEVQPTEVKKKPTPPVETVAPTPKEKPIVKEQVVVEKTTLTEIKTEKSNVDQEKKKLQDEMAALKAEQEKLAAQKAKISQQIEENKKCDEIKDWVATEGSTLRGLLTQWGDEAGWRVVWNMERDYTLEAGAVFRGRFMDVSAALLRSFARARPAPKGVFYKGNKVLVVSTREDENAE